MVFVQPSGIVACTDSCVHVKIANTGSHTIVCMSQLDSVSLHSDLWVSLHSDSSVCNVSQFTLWLVRLHSDLSVCTANSSVSTVSHFTVWLVSLYSAFLVLWVSLHSDSSVSTVSQFTLWLLSQYCESVYTLTRQSVLWVSLHSDSSVCTQTCQSALRVLQSVLCVALQSDSSVSTLNQPALWLVSQHIESVYNLTCMSAVWTNRHSDSSVSTLSQFTIWLVCLQYV